MDRTLVVLRHAKAVAHDPERDHERDLSEQGTGDAAELGRWLAEQGLLPDLVLVSTAARTRQTAERALAGAGVPDAEVWPGRAIYVRGPEGALGAVHEAPDDASVVWLVGHEPTLSTLILHLVDPAASAQDAVGTVQAKFRTGTAAVLRVPVAWDGLGAGMATLEQVHTARA